MVGKRGILRHFRASPSGVKPEELRKAVEDSGWQGLGTAQDLGGRLRLPFAESGCSGSCVCTAVPSHTREALQFSGSVLHSLCRVGVGQVRGGAAGGVGGIRDLWARL